MIRSSIFSIQPFLSIEEKLFKVFSMKIDNDKKFRLLKRFLESEQVDINFINDDGFSILRKAVFSGDVKIVSLLLEAGACPNTLPRENSSPLLVAAYYNFEEIATLLLQKGANIEAADLRGRTPLCIAAYRNNQKIVQLLIESGANIEAQDKKKNTPLYLSISHYNYQITALLLSKGAKIRPCDRLATILFDNEQALQLILENEANLNQKDVKMQLASETISFIKKIIGNAFASEDADIESYNFNDPILYDLYYKLIKLFPEIPEKLCKKTAISLNNAVFNKMFKINSINKSEKVRGDDSFFPDYAVTDTEEIIKAATFIINLKNAKRVKYNDRI